MELIRAIVVAGPIGYLTETRRRGLVMCLAPWAIIFPIQTVVVFSTSGDVSDVLYWVSNALILCLGIGLNRLGSSPGRAQAGSHRARGSGMTWDPSRSQ